jgi:hypothetical protein
MNWANCRQFNGPSSKIAGAASWRQHQFGADTDGRTSCGPHIEQQKTAQNICQQQDEVDILGQTGQRKSQCCQQPVNARACQPEMNAACRGHDR